MPIPQPLGRKTAVLCVSMATVPKISRNVAVIGAGAAGLVSIRELLREGHKVTAFEQGPQLGGVWVYDTTTDSDPLGATGTRRRVHGSMYRDLRTNLPRELMGFSDVPFTPELMRSASSDPRRFCSHTEVLSYLQMFADLHQLQQHVRFNTQVLAAVPAPAQPDEHTSSSSSKVNGSSAANGSHAGAAHGINRIDNDSSGSSSCVGPKWCLDIVQLDAVGQAVGPPVQQEFDALLVCNGHYSEPNLPEVAGADAWPGRQMHSHNYRVPEAFTDQVVVVVGASNSGEDVCREVSEVAKSVVVAARSWKNPEWGHDPRPFGPKLNVSRRGMISKLHSDGRVEFSAGPPLTSADCIIYCTGYVYRFAFLEQHPATSGLSGQQYVPGLFRHMFVPQLGPSLAFVGLPWKVVPFPQFELQAKLIARLLSGRAELPPVSDMLADTAAYYQQLEAAGTPLRWAHMMNELQWQYNDWLAAAAGPDVLPLPAWRPAMYASTGANKRAHPDDYRDRWDDELSAAEAEQQLAKLAQQLLLQVPTK